VNFRSALLAIASLVAGLALLGLLVFFSGMHLKEVLSRLIGIDKLACLRLALLTAVNTFLSSQKWRVADRAIRHTSDGSPSQFESFALSSIGTALGQVLPVQVSMSIARTIGTHKHGRAFQRGTLGTLFEQSFDLLFICFLMIASAATYLLHGGWIMWLAIAVPSAGLAMISAGAILAILKRLATKVSPEGASATRWRRFVAELRDSALLEPKLGRTLMLLSGLRFVTLILMAGQTTAAIHANVPLWHLAATMPFAVLATATGITPGGLGITEFTYAGILRAFGTPIAVATQWAVVNRLLVSASSIVVALLLLPFFAAFRTTPGEPASTMQ
jgi:uncharacterized membrane protein YbhN (UPF0104 family)